MMIVQVVPFNTATRWIVSKILGEAVAAAALGITSVIRAAVTLASIPFPTSLVIRLHSYLLGMYRQYLEMLQPPIDGFSRPVGGR